MGMKAIINAADTIIQAAITASTGALNDVGTNVYKGGDAPPPQAVLPSILIIANSENRQHKRAAGTAPAGFGEQYKWSIAIVSTTGNLTTSFEQTCDIWEELKPIVDTNYTWDGVVQDTNYDGEIEYGSPIIGDRGGLTFVILVHLISNIRWGSE